jgi:Flp pilus assembly pilin Flp
VKDLFSTNRLIRRFDAASEEGQALVEYALILGAIAILAFASLHLLGENVNAVLNLVASGFGGL